MCRARYQGAAGPRSRPWASGWFRSAVVAVFRSGLRAGTLSPAGPLDHAARAHLGVGIGQDPVEALHALQPGRIIGDRIGRRALWFPAEVAERTDVGQDVPGIAEAILAGRDAGLIGAVLAHDDVGELPGRHRLTAADVEHLAGGPLIGQHENIGVDDVVDVDVIADRRAVFVQDRRNVLQIAQAEDAAGTGVRVIDRLPWPLHDAVAQRDRRYP